MSELNRKCRPLALAVLLGAAACATPQPNPTLAKLNVSTRIGPNNVCSQGVSPAISVGGAPRGTAQYRVRLSDVDVLVQSPWEATVATAGGDIPEGAASGFPAPCLSDEQDLIYRIEVMALDAGGRPLAYGQARTIVQAPGRLARSGLRLNVPSAPASPGQAQTVPAPQTPQRPPLPFNRAAGVLEGPYVLNDQNAARGPNSGDALDPFNRVSARIVRPQPVPTAPTVAP